MKPCVIRNKKQESVFEDEIVQPKLSIRPEYQGKIIFASSGIGKSFAAELNDRLIDGDRILASILETTVAELPEKLKTLDRRGRKETFSELENQFNEFAKKGFTILTPNEYMLDVADYAFIQNDPEKMAQSTANEDRENPYKQTVVEAKTRINRYKKNIEEAGLDPILLDRNNYLSNYLFAENNPVERISEDANNELNSKLVSYLANFGISVRQLENIQKQLGVDSLGFVDLLNKVAYIEKNNPKELPYVTGKFVAYMMQYRGLVTDIYKGLRKSMPNAKKEELLDQIGIMIGDRILGKETSADNLSFTSQIIKAIDNILTAFFRFIRHLDFVNVNKNVGIIAQGILDDNVNMITASKYKPGAEGKPVGRVGFLKALAKDEFAGIIVENLAKEGFILTGSVTLAEQGSVFRPFENQVHDLDWVSPYSREQTNKMFKELYPENIFIREIVNEGYSTDTYIIAPEGYEVQNIEIVGERNTVLSYDVVNKKTGEVEGTYKLVDKKEVTTGDVEAKLIDFFSYDEKTGDTDTSRFSILPSGQKLNIAEFQKTFRAKLDFKRLKDIWDYNRYIPKEQFRNLLDNSTEFSTLSVTASNGKPSKLFKELNDFFGDEELALKLWAKTYTADFQKWFKNSKAVDENGEPQLVFLSSSNIDGSIEFTTEMGKNPSFLNIKKPQSEDTEINQKNDGVITEDGKYVVEHISQVEPAIEETLPDSFDMAEEPGITFDLDTVTSNLDKTIRFKNAQIMHLNEVLRKTNKDIKIQEENINKKEAKEKLKELYRLEKESEDRITQIKNELENINKNRTMESIVEMANNSFARLDYLLNKENPQPEDLAEANGIVSFYEKIKITKLKDVEHPLFPHDFMVKNNEINRENISLELEQYLNKLANIAESRKEDLEIRKQQHVEKIINRNTNIAKMYPGGLSYQQIIEKAEGLADASFWDMWTMDPTLGTFSRNVKIPGVVFAQIQNSEDRHLQIANKLMAKIDKIKTKLEDELRNKFDQGIKILGAIKGVSYNMFKQVNDIGLETGNIVHRYSTSFFNNRRVVMKYSEMLFNLSKKQKTPIEKKKKFQEAIDHFKDWHRHNTIQLDLGRLSAIFEEEEFVEFAEFFDKKGSKEHEQELIDTLGQIGYEEEVAKQIKLLRRYMAQKKEMADFYKSDVELQKWEAVNNPFAGNTFHYTDRNTSSITEESFPNFKFNVSVPRKNKVLTTVDPKTKKINFIQLDETFDYYDKNFEKIESSPILYEFHKLLTSILKEIRKGFPPRLQEDIQINSLIAVKRSATEVLMEEDSFSTAASKLSMNFWQSMKNLFSENISDSNKGFGEGEINLATGEANYTIDASFLKANSKKINNLETVYLMEFSEKLGLDKITDFTKIEKHSSEKQNKIDAINKNMESLFEKIKKEDNKLKKAGLIKKYNFLKNKRSKIITYKTISEKPGALKYLADLLGVQATEKAVKEKLGNKDHYLKNLINQIAVHQTVQDQSFDLPKVMKYYLNLSAKFQARQEVKPIVDALKGAYEKIKQGEDGLGEIRAQANEQFSSYYNRNLLLKKNIKNIEDLENKILSEDEEVEGLKRFFNIVANRFNPKILRRNLNAEQKIIDEKLKKLLKTNLTPQQRKDLEARRKNLGEVYVGWGIVNAVTVFTRLVQLGWNIFSPVTNMMEGEIANMRLLALGVFSEDDYWKANHVARQSWVKNITYRATGNLLVTDDAIKLRTMMDKLGRVQDSSNELQKSSAESSYSQVSVYLDPYELNRRTEYLIQSKIVAAMLMKEKIKDRNGNESSVWDALNPDGTLKPEFASPKNLQTWQNLNTQKFLDWTSTVEALVNHAHGNYGETRGMKMKESEFGRAIGMFKTWFPMALASRWAIEQDNVLLGIKDFKGTYRSMTSGGATAMGGVLGFSTLGLMMNPFLGIVVGATAANLWASMPKKKSSQIKLALDDESSLLSGIEENVFAMKVLAQKALGMPVRRIFGVNIMDAIGGTNYEKYVRDENPHFTQHDARNMNANMTESALHLQRIAMMYGLYYLAQAFMAPEEGEDEEKDRPWWFNFIMNQLGQLNQNHIAFSNLEGFKETVGSTGVEGLVANVLDLVVAGNDYIGDRDLVRVPGTQRMKSGLYESITDMTPQALRMILQGKHSKFEKVYSKTAFDEVFKPKWKKENQEIDYKKRVFKHELTKRKDKNGNPLSEYMIDQIADEVFKGARKKDPYALQKKIREYFTYYDKYGNQYVDLPEGLN